MVKASLFWIMMIVAASATSSTVDISVLKDIAAGLGVPTNVWRFDIHPCKWQGINCCSLENLQSTCCNERFVPDSPCNSSNSSIIVGINLDYNYINVKMLTGHIPSSICNITSLITLDVNNNFLSGNIPSCIGDELKQLKYLRLATNSLTGGIPHNLGELTNLQQLYLDNNALWGTIPPSLGNLQNLLDLFLRGNKLSGPIPMEIGRLSNLVNLELQVNQLNGTLPSSLASLTKLQIFKLFDNDMSGDLPLSIFQNMSDLVNLQLRFNNFIGQIPAFDQRFRNLSQLDLGFNQFTGAINDSLGGLISLTQLFLGHNKLSGELPKTFSSLTKLQVLDISHNLLTGSLKHLPQIPNLHCSFNSFDITSAPKKVLQQEKNPYFNCIPSGSNSRNQTSCFGSLPGKETSFAINVGSAKDIKIGHTIFRADAEANGTGLYYLSSNNNWAVEISGENSGTFQNPFPRKLHNVPVGEDPLLYQHMRWSSSYLAYHGSSLQNGVYNVTIYFAETVFQNSSFRVFDILLQGKVEVKNLDVVEKAGFQTAYSVHIPCTVTDGTLSVEFLSRSKDRYLNSDYGVSASGPMVSAISVSSPNSHTSSLMQIVVPIVAVISCLIVCAAVFFIYWRRMKAKKVAEDTLGEAANMGLTSYTYKELCDATQGFNIKMKLGEGGFGIVHKGCLNRNLIAVKQITHQTARSKEAFKKEIQVLSSVQHRNLLAIRGYCIDGHPMLVVDYMPNGSLDQVLYEKGRVVLTWEQRHKIASNTALGLAYLHGESKHKIIHCDVKPPNILLDEDFQPKIADFGMARLCNDEQSHITATRMAGTVGYMAPEYVMHYQLSDKVDVYSFGVVLLELISGRRALEDPATIEPILVNWAHRLASISTLELSRILDKRLEDKCPMKEVIDMAVIAVLCTQEAASSRPDMHSVWLMLHGLMEIPELTMHESLKFDSVKALMSAYERASYNGLS